MLFTFSFVHTELTLMSPVTRANTVSRYRIILPEGSVPVHDSTPVSATVAAIKRSSISEAKTARV